MRVEVVAVRGVHVGTHPQAGVGDQHTRRPAPGGDPLVRGRDRLGRQQLLDSERRRLGLLAAADQPGFDERMVVIARDDHQLALSQGRAEILEEGTRGGHRVAQRAMA